MPSNLLIVFLLFCACEYAFSIQNISNTHIFFFFFLQFCCFLKLFKTLQASSDSCDVSRTTVQTVEDCPRSEERWREAAARKNCASYASQCSDPEKLEYHCVINPFLNQTLEVCAYAQNIVLGKLFTIDLINSS